MKAEIVWFFAKCLDLPLHEAMQIKLLLRAVYERLRQ
jgi:hypothetical protein